MERSTVAVDGMPITRLVLDSLFGRSGRPYGLDELRRLAEVAQEQALVPVLAAYGRAQGWRLPDTLRQANFTHRARLALIRQRLRQVVETLEPHMPVIVLKGEPLATLLYGDGSMRSTTDIDVLVRAQDLFEAERRISPLGYERLGAFRPFGNNHLVVGEAATHLEVELHWQINRGHLPTPPEGWVMAAPHSVTVGARSYDMLRPEPLLLQLCFHFHHHRGFLKGLLDITGWLDRFERVADLDEIAGIAGHLGIGGVLQWPLHALYYLTGYDSRLRQPASPYVQLWAWHTTSLLLRRYADLADDDGRAFSWAPPTFWAKVANSGAVALSNCVADRWTVRLRGLIDPMVHGPHRLGQFVHRAGETIGLFHTPFERRSHGHPTGSTSSPPSAG